MHSHFLVFFASLFLTLASCDKSKKDLNPFLQSNYSFSLSIDKYASCDEIGQEARDILTQDEIEPSQEGVEDSQNTGTDATDENIADSSSSSNEILTNVQEKGIDESDSIKVSEHNIYVLRDTNLIITRKKDLSLIGVLELKKSTRKMYVTNGKIILISDQSFIKKGVETKKYVPTYDLSIYKEEIDKLPSLIKEEEIIARHVSSRLKNGLLVYVNEIDNIIDTQQQHLNSEILEFKDQKLKGIECNQITKKPVNDLDYRLTVVHLMDMSKDDLPVRKEAILGGGDEIYMGQKNLYVSKGITLSTNAWDYERSLIITKIGIDEDKKSANATARGMVQGYTIGQYAYKEFVDSDVLGIVTTTKSSLEMELNHSDDKPKVGRNHLWVLEQQDTALIVTNKILNLGEPGEDVKSVRFENNYAYIVTFEITDPLYAINMSDPKIPLLEGELKIPGFSTYMHPTGNDQLVGIGFDSIDSEDSNRFLGIQVSLFDTAHSNNLKRTDVKVLGERGSSSDVTRNPRAFHFDPEEQVFALPITMFARGKPSFPHGYITKVEFSGAIFYRVSADKLKEVKRLSHSNFMPFRCTSEMTHRPWVSKYTDVSRIYSIGDHYVTISHLGIRSISKESLETLDSLDLKFPNPTQACNF